MTVTASPSLARQTERWFVRRGTPTMIQNYAFVSHVLPRMLPALVFVTVGSLAWLVPIRSVGSARWVMLGVVLVLTVASWVTVSMFVRRLPSFSRPAMIAILAVYAAMPVAVPLLQLAVDDAVTPPGVEDLRAPGELSATGLLVFVLFFAVVFVATVLATTYGVGTLLRRAIQHALY